MGPFRINISPTAELVDLTSLEEAERKQLLRDVTYDSSKHQIFRFFVTPKFYDPYSSKRWSKRRSYAKVDRALVQVECGAPEIVIFGIHPITTLRDGQESLDFEGESILELAVPKFFKLSITGKLKNKIRKDTHLIFASRTAEFAQWVFLKGFIRTNTEYKLRVLCVVPASLEKTKRHVVCHATFSDGGRVIESATFRKVFFP